MDWHYENRIGIVRILWESRAGLLNQLGTLCAGHFFIVHKLVEYSISALCFIMLLVFYPGLKSELKKKVLDQRKLQLSS